MLVYKLQISIWGSIIYINCPSEDIIKCSNTYRQPNIINQLMFTFKNLIIRQVYKLTLDLKSGYLILEITVVCCEWHNQYIHAFVLHMALIIYISTTGCCCTVCHVRRLTNFNNLNVAAPRTEFDTMLLIVNKLFLKWNFCFNIAELYNIYN